MYLEAVNPPALEMGNRDPPFAHLAGNSSNLSNPLDLPQEQDKVDNKYLISPPHPFALVKLQ